MDPNETLELLRKAVNAGKVYGDESSREREIRWAFEDLDTWLSKGGFLPTRWERKERNRVIPRANTPVV